MFRLILAFIFAALTLASPLPGRSDVPIHLRNLTSAERKSVTASITAQLKAFQKNDYARAIFYQSAALKHNFASPGTFQRMMKSSYPEFTNYKTVQFGKALADTDGKHVQIQVVVTGQDNITLHAVYLMVLETKIYRVEGVMGGANPRPQLSPSPEGAIV